MSDAMDRVELEVTYKRTPCMVPGTELRIERRSWWWTPRPLPELTEEDLKAVPHRFRCYWCGALRKRKEFGGLILNQRICRTCYPWTDWRYVGHQIRWDLHWGYSNYVRKEEWQ